MFIRNQLLILLGRPGVRYPLNVYHAEDAGHQGFDWDNTTIKGHSKRAQFI